MSKGNANHNMNHQELAEEEIKRYPLGQSATFGGSTFALASLIDALAHLGPTGMLISGLAGYVAWKHGPEVYEYVQERVREAFPPTASTDDEEETDADAGVPAEPRTQRGRSLLERMFDLPADQAEEQAHPKEAERVDFTPDLNADVRQAQAAGRGIIDLAPDLHVEVNDLAGKAIFIVGIRRSGKTTLGARLAEGFGAHLLPLLIPDLEGDYLSLGTVLPRGIIAHHPGADKRAYPGCRVAAISVQNAPKFGADLLAKGYQVVLDLSSYPTLEEAVTVQVRIIEGMFQWANSHPDERVTAQVYLDEAQRYLPQNLADSVLQDKLVLSALLKAYMDITAIGGKRGIAPVILSQRFAQTNNKIIAQSEVFFLMRQTMDNDLKRCMEYVRKTTANEAMISAFKQGQGVYIGADGTQLVTQFHKRRSSGTRSQTPKAEAAQRYAQMPLEEPTVTGAAPQQQHQDTTRNAPSPSSPLTLEKILTLFEQGKINEQTLVTLMNCLPTVSPEPEEDEKKQEPALPEMETLPDGVIAFPPKRQPSAALSPQLQRAYDAFESGMSYRDLATVLEDVNKDTAGKLIRELQRRKLISNDNAKMKLPG